MTKYNVFVGKALVGAALLTLAGIVIGFFEPELTKPVTISPLVPYLLLLILQALVFFWAAKQNPYHPIRQAIFTGIASCGLTLALSALLRVPDAPVVTILIDSAVFDLSFLLGTALAKAMGGDIPEHRA